jgi:hypothetical protein
VCVGHAGSNRAHVVGVRGPLSASKLQQAGPHSQLAPRVLGVCVNLTQACVNLTQACANLTQVCVNLTQDPALLLPLVWPTLARAQVHVRCKKLRIVT